jgi:RNA polymerase sigma factor (TIGR02999 family)
MSDITQLLREIRDGRHQSAEKLLSLVYTELKRIAAQKMAGEAPGNTLQPTALVHEAWIKLAGGGDPDFENRAHFFSAAAEAMRRILVDSARRKQAAKRGRGAAREELKDEHWVEYGPSEELLAVDEALDLLAKEDPVAANLVKLRYFRRRTRRRQRWGCLAMPRRWTYVRAWLGGSSGVRVGP